MVDKFDEVWKDCKIVYVCGIMVEIVGGVLIIVGGIVIIMIVGIVLFLLLVGMGVGVVGVGINLGISIMEVFINLSEIKKVEKDLKEIFDCINNVRNNV